MNADREKRVARSRQWRADNLVHARETNKQWNAAHREKLCEATRRYRATHRAQVREAERLRRAASPLATRAKKRRSYERNRAKRLDTMKRYYQANREWLDASGREWRKAHPEKEQGGFRRRARTYGVAYQPGITWRSVLAQHGDKCGLCGVSVMPIGHRADPLSATVDHKVPMSKGGAHIWANVQLAHRLCNVRRWTMDLDHWHAERRGIA